MSGESPPRVLLIDDSVDETTALSLLLELEGFAVEVANLGERGIEAATARVPDVVLLDLHMPGLDGFDVLAALKRDARAADVPVIVVSGSIVDTDIVRALESGASDYVTKPYALGILLARIRTAVRGRREKLAIWRLGEDLRDAQDELARARRSAALGALSAGLAHEINNPAAFVVADLHEMRELARDLAEAGDEERADALLALAEEALAGMNRIRDVVRDLSVFVSVVDRRSVPSFGALDLAEIVRARVQRLDGVFELHGTTTPALVAAGLGGEDELDALVGLLIRHATAAQQQASRGVIVRLDRGEQFVSLQLEAEGSSDPPSDSRLTFTIARELAERFGGTIESGEGCWTLRLRAAAT